MTTQTIDCTRGPWRYDAFGWCRDPQDYRRKLWAAINAKQVKLGRLAQLHGAELRVGVMASRRAYHHGHVLASAAEWAHGKVEAYRAHQAAEAEAKAKRDARNAKRRAKRAEAKAQAAAQ